MAVLLTGFGPYAEEADNPSGRIAAEFDGATVAGQLVHGRVLPVDTEMVSNLLAEAVDQIDPTVVVLTGVTPGRTLPAIERVAINVRDFPIPDVAGRAPVDATVIDGGPSAYFSSLPIKAILDRWTKARIDGFVSNSAGTYLCNQIFYLAQHLTAGSSTRAGLIHIPIPGDELEFAALRRVVELSIEVAITHVGPDLSLAAGATS